MLFQVELSYLIAESLYNNKYINDLKKQVKEKENIGFLDSTTVNIIKTKPIPKQNGKIIKKIGQIYKTVNLNIEKRKTIKNTKRFDLNEENFGLINTNPMLFKLEYNPLMKKESDELIDKSKLLQLKKAAFANENDPNPGKVKETKYTTFLQKLKKKKKRTVADETLRRNPTTFFKNFNNVVEAEEELKKQKGNL